MGKAAGVGFSLPEPLSRKSLTEISLVDKNMPAYTLFVQTNRQTTVMAVTQGMRLSRNKEGKRLASLPGYQGKDKSRD